MLRRLRPHSVIGINQEPLHYAFNMQHNLSHLLCKYPETGELQQQQHDSQYPETMTKSLRGQLQHDSQYPEAMTKTLRGQLQQHDSHFSEPVGIRVDDTFEVSSSHSKMGMLPLSSLQSSTAEDVIAIPQPTMDMDVNMEMLHNSRNSLMLHNQDLDSNMYEDEDMGSEADLEKSLFITSQSPSQSPSPGPSSSIEPSHDIESSAGDTSNLMDLIFDGADSDDEVNPDPQEDTDSSASEPLAWTLASSSNKKYAPTGLPLQPIHNSGTSPTSTLPDDPQSKSPISSDGSGPRYFQTAKNFQSRERRRRRKEKSGGPTTLKSRQPMRSHTSLSPSSPVEPRLLDSLLEPQLPIKKIIVLSWKNELSRALKLAETGQDDFKDAKQLAAILGAINRYKDHLPLKLLEETRLGKAVREFKHQTPYCQYQLSIKKTARRILEHWANKFYKKDISGQPLNEASTSAGSTPGL